MRDFILQVYDGNRTSSRIISAPSYVVAVSRYAWHYPPAYIWSIKEVTR